MLNPLHRAFTLVIPLFGLIGPLQACGSEDGEEGGTGFGDCVAFDQGFSSCDEYCASRSRACVLCDCPSAHRESLLCSGARQGSQYSAIGWKSNAACEGDINVAFAGCTQSVFRDSSGAVDTMSVKCCCE
jgi:hypothetical protein